jgi:non-ribosomal peptide synthetase component F
MQSRVLTDGIPLDERAGQGLDWVHELIARQAAITPTALAIQGQDQRLTFLELEQRANCLARHLQSLGVVAETPVGLYFERSADFVVAALLMQRIRREESTSF